MEKTYTSAIELTEDIWKNYSKQKKEELLNELGYDLSWAETKTINEMVKRGGGMVAKSIKNLALEMINRADGKLTIKW
jgi:hypothetical protein